MLYKGTVINLNSTALAKPTIFWGFSLLAFSNICKEKLKLFRYRKKLNLVKTLKSEIQAINI